MAKKRPELITDKLGKHKPALTSKEPQTRWMLMHVFGYCANLNPKNSESILDYAKEYMTENSGVCL